MSNKTRQNVYNLTFSSKHPEIVLYNNPEPELTINQRVCSLVQCTIEIYFIDVSGLKKMFSSITLFCIICVFICPNMQIK